MFRSSFDIPRHFQHAICHYLSQDSAHRHSRAQSSEERIRPEKCENIIINKTNTGDTRFSHATENVLSHAAARRSCLLNIVGALSIHT